MSSLPVPGSCPRYISHFLINFIHTDNVLWSFSLPTILYHPLPTSSVPLLLPNAPSFFHISLCLWILGVRCATIVRWGRLLMYSWGHASLGFSGLCLVSSSFAKLNVLQKISLVQFLVIRQRVWDFIRKMRRHILSTWHHWWGYLPSLGELVCACLLCGIGVSLHFHTWFFSVSQRKKDFSSPRWTGE